MAQPLSFGQQVKEYRRGLGLTQDELARRVGCAPVTLRKIEIDELRPSVQVAERLAMALNVALDERSAFVRHARSEYRPDPPTPTPSPSPDEIGLEDLSGHAIRGYALSERIGEGGMGVVYRAIQPLVEREVAVKIIRPQYANHPDFIRRFEAEAQLVARLEHPYIVPLYDYWREPGVAYLVMRLLRGGSVKDLLEHGPLSLNDTVRLVEQVGNALATAHRVGIIHRDLKPANILLDEDGNAYLADFGIAKNLSDPNREEMTQADAVIGSPAYISPEQIKSEFVRPQADIYCLGVVMYELLTGKVPFQGPTPIAVMYQHLSSPLPSLAVNRADLPPVLDTVIGKATAKDPMDRYASVEMLLTELRQAMNSHGLYATRPVEITTVESRPLTVEDNPYKGLRPFQEADAADFYGRESLIQQLLVRLGESGDLSRFLAVIGPSGSGKSSVVKAGVLPALRQGGLPGSDEWFIIEMLPGPRPLEELEAALLRIAVNPPESLLGQLREDNRGLLRAVNRCLPPDPKVELTLVIDQFEELFTLVADDTVREHFLDSLVNLVLDERSRVRVLITLRADFLDRPLRYVDFGELLRQRSELVLPLTPDELEQAITGPARRVGLALEVGLVSVIVHDVGEQPGTLPLLQYALTALFEHHEENHVDKVAYQAIGGVSGALTRQAEAVFNRLTEPEQAVARQLFLRLVTLGEGGEDTRRRVMRDELESLNSSDLELKNQVTKIIEAFGHSRLLTFDRDPITRRPVVEVAHEALLREWVRLREWLNESRADIRLQRQLATAAAEWQLGQRDASFLLAGVRLAQFEGWAKSSSVRLTPDEQTFLDASVFTWEKAERARQQAEAEARTAHRLRRLTIALVGMMLVAVVLAVLAFSESNRATARANDAAAAQINAENNAQLAQTRQSEAVEAQNIAQTGANALATSEIEARESAQLAQTRVVEANVAQATAVAAQGETARLNQQIRAQQLAAQAELLLPRDPELALLLAVATMNRYASTDQDMPEVRQSLFQTLNSPYQGTLYGHEGRIRSASFSPDGHWLVTGSEDGTARIWDIDRGTESHVLREHIGTVWSVAYNPDGSLIATAGDDGLVRLWDATTGQRQTVLTGHTDRIWSVKFSSDGQHLLTAGADGTARLWNVATGVTTVVLSGHTAGVYAINFSPDGTRALTGSEDFSARLWDVATGQEIAILEGHTSWLEVVNFNSAGSRIVTAGWDGTAWLWDGTTGEPIATLVGHTDDWITSASFSPDDTQILTASADGTARLWDGVTGEAMMVLSGHEDKVLTARFSPDGTYIVTSGEDGTAHLWDATTGKTVAILSGHSNAIYAAIFSPDGSRIVTASDDGTIRLWNGQAASNAVTLSGHRGDVYRASFSPDGTRLVTAGADGTAQLWNRATGLLKTVLVGHQGRILGVAFTPDGSQIATASADGTARLWQTNTGEALHVLSGHTGEVIVANFSPSGDYLVTAGVDGTARLWDVSTGESVAIFSGHRAGVHAASFSPDNTLVLTASDDGTARVWDVASGAEILVLDGHGDWIESASFSPDGTHIVTASWDGTARLWDGVTGAEIAVLSGQVTGIEEAQARPWDVTTEEEIAVLIGHTGDWVTSASFSPDGTKVVTAGADRTARIWDATTGDPIAVLAGHSNWITSVNFSPDGTRLLTASLDGTARLWDVATGASIMVLAGHSDWVYAAAFDPEGTAIVTVSKDGTARLWVVGSYDVTVMLAEAGQRLHRGLTAIECQIYFQSEWQLCVAEAP